MKMLLARASDCQRQKGQMFFFFVPWSIGQGEFRFHRHLSPISPSHLERSRELVRGLRRRGERLLQQLLLLLQNLDARGRGGAARGGAARRRGTSSARGGASDDDGGGRLCFCVVSNNADVLRAGRCSCQRVPHFFRGDESPSPCQALEHGRLRLLDDESESERAAKKRDRSNELRGKKKRNVVMAKEKR